MKKQEFHPIIAKDNQIKTKKYLKSEHVWKEDEGYINIFGNESSDHNGPVCINCGYNKCWHCFQTPPKKCPGKK